MAPCAGAEALGTTMNDCLGGGGCTAELHPEMVPSSAAMLPADTRFWTRYELPGSAAPSGPTSRPVSAATHNSFDLLDEITSSSLRASPVSTITADRAQRRGLALCQKSAVGASRGHS